MALQIQHTHLVFFSLVIPLQGRQALKLSGNVAMATCLDHYDVADSSQ